MTVEERIRDATRAHGAGIAPSPDAWETIRARTRSTPETRRSRILIPLAAVVGVAALVIAGAVIVRTNEDAEPRVQAPPATTGPLSDIVAATDDGRIVVLDPTTGKELRVLADGADADTTITVTPDGSRIFYDRPSSADSDPPREIVTVPTEGGTVQRFIGGAASPRVSPDGTRLAFLCCHNTSPDPRPSGIDIVDLPDTFDSWTPNVVAAGVSPEGTEVANLSWSSDSQSVVFTLFNSAQGSYPRLARVSQGMDLGAAPIIPIGDGRRPVGFLGRSGQLLASSCVSGSEEDQRLRIITIDPTTGDDGRILFRYPAVCGPERLASDASGRHVLVWGPAGLYRWSQGDDEPVKVTDGIAAAAWTADTQSVDLQPPTSDAPPVTTTGTPSNANGVRPREAVRVIVINATGVPNVAVLKSNQFRALGYQLVSPIEDAQQRIGETIACRTGFEEEARRLEVDSLPAASDSAPPVLRPEIVPFEEPPRAGTEDADRVMIIGNTP